MNQHILQNILDSTHGESVKVRLMSTKGETMTVEGTNHYRNAAPHIEENKTGEIYPLRTYKVVGFVS